MHKPHSTHDTNALDAFVEITYLSLIDRPICIANVNRQSQPIPGEIMIQTIHLARLTHELRGTVHRHVRVRPDSAHSNDARGKSRGH